MRRNITRPGLAGTCAILLLSIAVLVGGCSGSSSAPSGQVAAQNPAPSAASGARVAATLLAASEEPPAPGAPPFTVEEMLKLKRISDPQLSPDGTRIAFVLTEVNLEANSRANHIWLVKTTGGVPAPLITSPKSDDTPRWSPDGRRLAFVSSRDGASQVWIADVDAAGVARAPRKLTNIATEASGVRWAPDAKSLVFVSDVYPACPTLDCNQKTLAAHEANKVRARLLEGLLFRHWTAWKEGRFSHLFLVPADGSRPPRDLTPGKADVPPFSLGGPDEYAFSPDSREIAFARKTATVEAVSTNSDLFVLDLVNPDARARQITPNPAADGGPVYSPDGRYIAYRAQSRPGFESDRWQLMLFDRQSGQSRALAAKWDRAVDSCTWTPDSKALYITAEDQARSVIFSVDVAGGTPQPLPIPASSGDVQLTADGRAIVFSSSSASSPTELYRAGADGSGITAITRVNAGALVAFNLRPAESVSYAGAGGARIQAWIVKPPNFRDDR
jgi:dipeptidyl aminopeptidase/acylaminoacyl peptidase